jgi:hypothetical protein
MLLNIFHFTLFRANSIIVVVKEGGSQGELGVAIDVCIQS